MYRISLTLAFFFLGLFTLQAQCEDCPEVPSDFTVDFCYTDSLFGGFCGQFSEKKEFFLLKRKKKYIQIPLTEKLDEAYLVGLAKEKSYKLTALEILFVSDAVKKWNKAKMMIGYEIQESGLGIKMVEEGTGKLPQNGKKVTVHYTGKLLDGTQFDSSIDRGQPFSFVLGQGRVIKGWDEGVAKLKVGSKAWLQIPPTLGYGARGAGGVIPPNATLLFYVEVLEAAE